MTSRVRNRLRRASTPMIVMECVAKWYGSFKVLSDIKLSSGPGEQIVLGGR